MKKPRAVIEFYDTKDGLVTFKLLIDGKHKEVPIESLTKAQSLAAHIMYVVSTDLNYYGYGSEHPKNPHYSH